MARYRAIDAPAKSALGPNKVQVYATANSASDLAAHAKKGRLIQESLGEGFAPDDVWDWEDWAHKDGIATGFLRNA